MYVCAATPGTYIYSYIFLLNCSLHQNVMTFVVSSDLFLLISACHI